MGLKMNRRHFIASTGALLTASSGLSIRAQTADPASLTIAEAGSLIREGLLTSEALTLAYLARIQQYEDKVNAYITVTEREALRSARRMDNEISRGHWRGPMHGIPIALKDNIDTQGILTTGASALFANRIPGQDAEVVRRLKAAGAVILGKLNLHEFAFGGSTKVTHYGPTHNPWDLEYIPGGSSGGSGAAVAARLCAGALGTDTAASVRMPASFCGIAGFKPTYGLSSIRGIFPLSESLDHVGPMCRTVEDCAIMLQAMAGYDPQGVSSIKSPDTVYTQTLDRSVSDLRLGIPQELFYDELDPEVASAMDTATLLLNRMTAGHTRVSLPPTPPFPPIISEAYTYHAEYVKDEANHKLYQPVTLNRVLAGANTSFQEYSAAKRQLNLSRKAIAAVFEEVDLLITPTTPVLPEKIAVWDDAAIKEIPEITARNTLPFNFYGIPAITVPCGFSKNGLPIGLQISGPHLGELHVLQLAHAYEKATAWHKREAPIA